MIEFEDRVAIVTGAGGGLDKTYATLLASRDAAVVVNDLGGSVHGEGKDDETADTVVAQIEAAGGTAVAEYSSVAEPEGGEAIVQKAIDTFGRVDILINNAGILRDRTLSNMEWSDLDAVLDVHLKGAFYVSQPAFNPT